MVRFLKWVFNFHEEKRQLLHIILIAFLLSFFIIRGYSSLTGNSIFINGYHIHHFYFGMFFASVGGILGVLSRERKGLRIASALIGIGIGLFADEIGLLLNCTTANRQCLYAFPGFLDFAVYIASAILALVILVGLIEEYSDNEPLEM